MKQFTDNEIYQLKHPHFSFIPYLISISMLAVTIAAFALNETGLQNIVQVFAVILGILGIVAGFSLAHEKEIYLRASQIPSKKAPFSLTPPLLAGTILLYHGWFFVGILYIIGMIMLFAVKLKITETRTHIIAEHESI